MADFTTLIDLAAERLGGRCLSATDEFFAEKENLLKPGRGVFIDGKYTDRGKWMDGWESRRRRGPGHDWCVIRLGLAGTIRGVDVDTNHFLGNYPEHASVEACASDGDLDEATWTEIVPITRLAGGTRNLLPVADASRFTHLRLHIYPDGGVARFRVHGEVVPDRAALAGKEIDLAAVEHGGVVVLANDSFFGPKDNLILPGPSLHMGDGWETKRKRGPGHDWVVVRLAGRGLLDHILVDTAHFKGNFPDACSIEGLALDGSVPDEFIASRSLPWTPVLGPSKLGADTVHRFDELVSTGPFTHLRLNIYPDGGIARLRVLGTLDA